MTFTRGRAVAFSAIVLAFCAPGAAPSWGQQGTLRSQTDEVQRAIAEALRQANAGQRRNAARAELQRRGPEGMATRTPESEGSIGGSDTPLVPPIPDGERH